MKTPAERLWTCEFCGCEAKTVWVLYRHEHDKPQGDVCVGCYGALTNAAGWLTEEGEKKLKEARDEV